MTLRVFGLRDRKGKEMNISRIVKLCFLAIGIMCCWTAASVNSEIVDQIVAILNEDLILLSDIREQAIRPAARAVANLESEATLQDDTLHYLVERQLLAHEVQYLAVPRDIERTKELAIRYVAATYYRQESQAFFRAVQTTGITDAELEEELMLYMKGIDYIRRKYRFNEDVDDDDRVFALFTNWLNELRDQATLQMVF